VRHSIFSLGSNNHLYNYAWAWTSSGGTWTLTDLTNQVALPSGATPTGTPSGNAFVISGTLYQHVVVVGSDGHVYEYWYNGGGNWQLNTSVIPAPPPGVTFTGSATTYSYTLPGSSVVHHTIYVLSTFTDLFAYDWTWSSTGGTWTLTNVSQTMTGHVIVGGGGGGVTLTGVPSGNYFTVNGTGEQHVVVTGSDGHLYEYWQFAGPTNGWGLNDLSTVAPLGGGRTVTGSPYVYSYTIQGDSATHHSVQIVASDGRQLEYAWAQGTGNGTWTVYDHMTPTGISHSGYSPTGFGY
jgi:hypothetical protein